MPSCFSRCSAVLIDLAPCSAPTLSPEISEAGVSASLGLQKPRPINSVIRSCGDGHAIEAMHEFHPDSISISEGKPATLTRRLTSMIVRLSKEAILVASASTTSKKMPEAAVQ
jgi:hypothetical protein